MLPPTTLEALGVASQATDITASTWSKALSTKHTYFFWFVQYQNGQPVKLYKAAEFYRGTILAQEYECGPYKVSVEYNESTYTLSWNVTPSVDSSKMKIFYWDRNDSYYEIT